MNLIKKTLQLMGSSNRKRKRQKLNKKVIVQKVTTKKTVDIGINTDKQLKDYKIFVFDLDNTLYLHKVIESENYHKKLKNFLVYLKDQDKKLYIATHNFFPKNLLDK